jgi:hypothetical protein
VHAQPDRLNTIKRGASAREISSRGNRNRAAADRRRVDRVHLVTPWWTTPLASNGSEMDDTLHITVIVTGIFFVVINLFIVYAVWRYRHRAGARSPCALADAPRRSP